MKKPRVFKFGLRIRWWVRTPNSALYSFATWRDAMDFAESLAKAYQR